MAVPDDLCDGDLHAERHSSQVIIVCAAAVGLEGETSGLGIEEEKDLPRRHAISNTIRLPVQMDTGLPILHLLPLHEEEETTWRKVFVCQSVWWASDGQRPGQNLCCIERQVLTTQRFRGQAALSQAEWGEILVKAGSQPGHDGHHWMLV